MRKIFLLFKNGEKEDDIDPINFENKRGTYIALFQKLESKGYDVYTSGDFNKILNSKQYLTSWKFENNILVRKEEIVEPTCVLDLSGSLIHPTKLQTNVLNQWDFKHFASNKFVSYLAFPELSPQTILYTNPNLIEKYLQTIKTDKVVIKPVAGLKGNGVTLVDKNNLDAIKQILNEETTNKYILQEFLDTNVQINDVINGPHDIRIVLIGKTIIWSNIRKPLLGDFRSNVAQGGSIADLDPKDIPEDIAAFIDIVSNKIAEMFGSPMYSIDLGITPDGPKIIEFNSRMGFPREDSSGKEFFIEKLVERLLEL